MEHKVVLLTRVRIIIEGVDTRAALDGRWLIRNFMMITVEVPREDRERWVSASHVRNDDIDFSVEQLVPAGERYGSEVLNDVLVRRDQVLFTLGFERYLNATKGFVV